MKTRTLAVLLFTCMLLLVAGLAAAAQDKSAGKEVAKQDKLLTVVQDEKSMEQTIARYLRTAHSLIVDEKYAPKDPEDLYLELPYKGDPMPKFRITVDSQPLNRDKNSNKVIERGVLINLYTDVRVPKDKTDAAMVAINEWNRKKAFSSIYIDTDGEVICCWILNVLNDGLATEYVYDAVARVQNIWKGLYPSLSEAIGS